MRAMARNDGGRRDAGRSQGGRRRLAAARRGGVRARDGAGGGARAARATRFGAAVEEALLDRLGLKIGDTFELGAARFVIRAELVSEPDRLATGIGFGPRVLISQDALRASGLVQPGSLVRWTTRVALAPAARRRARPRVEAFVDEAKAAFPEAGWETRNRDRTSRPDFSRDLDRFGEFLALVGLISLVVGGVGVANAAQGFVERKRATLGDPQGAGRERRRGRRAGAGRISRRGADRRRRRAGDRRGDALRRRGAVRRRRCRCRSRRRSTRANSRSARSTAC